MITIDQGLKAIVDRGTSPCEETQYACVPQLYVKSMLGKVMFDREYEKVAEAHQRFLDRQFNAPWLNN